eukprot:c15002_g1_i1.p1 GENE.c15002_g1_i1~~c15002_g1_i1.p1  ORF type:complete len:416 (+),score=79.72 c15002_g1_i1:31-1248(+)
MSVGSWLRIGGNALIQQNGDQLNSALSYDEKIANPTLLTEIRNMSEQALENICMSALSDEWAPVFSNHFRCVGAWGQHDFESALQSHKAVMTAFQKIFNRDDTVWMLSVFISLCKSLKLIAEQVQAEQKRQGKPATALQDIVDILRKRLSDTNSDRSNFEVSKKRAALPILNMLLKIGFQDRNVQLCQSFLKVATGPAFPGIKKFNLAEQVTFLYFRGRLALLDADYEHAESDLLEAFQNCPRNNLRNKRLILWYLIPVRLLAGQYPTSEFLQKYNLTIFEPICNALKRGQIDSLDSYLDTHQGLLLRKGLYLLMQRTRMIAFRNLFRRVYRFEGSERMKLASFEAAMRTVCDDVDTEEVQCIIGNLILLGMLKGYISRQHKLVVLSNKDPFPAFPNRALLAPRQ